MSTYRDEETGSDYRPKVYGVVYERGYPTECVDAHTHVGREKSEAACAHTELVKCKSRLGRGISASQTSKFAQIKLHVYIRRKIQTRGYSPFYIIHKEESLTQQNPLTFWTKKEQLTIYFIKNNYTYIYLCLYFMH